jgi:hypothetical protein
VFSTKRSCIEFYEVLPQGRDDELFLYAPSNISFRTSGSTQATVPAFRKGLASIVTVLFDIQVDLVISGFNP